MRFRLIPILAIAAIAAAAVFAAVTAKPANSFPSQAQACTTCHPTAPASTTVSATPSTAAPAAGSAYSVTIDMAGLTSSGDTGYWISNATGTPAVSVFGGDAGTNQPSYTQSMTAPSAPGTYSYTVWCERGSRSSGQAKSTTYSITVPAPQAPAISSLSPASGLVGSSFTITGSNFGASSPSNTVSVGGSPATTTAWSATSITAVVPNGLTAGAKNVAVTSGGLTSAASTASSFTVTVPAPQAPAISSLSPASGLVGSSFTITGSNFGASSPSNTVSVGGSPATTTAWSATSITVTVPANATVGAKAVIVTSGGQSSAAATFTVNAPIPVPVQAPSISSLSPESGLVGSSLTITGTDFGAGGTVSVGGANAIITAWNDNAITVTVPADLTAGAQDVTVTSGGLTSVAVTFTVNAPQDPPNGTDTTPPTTTASGVDDDDWYNHAILIHLTATDNSGGSGVASITYSVDGGAPITVSGSTATVIIGVETEADDDEDAPEHRRDGAHFVTYFATDNAGNVELAHTLTVNTDTERPSTEAPRSSRVRRNQTATLSYRITDATPNGGTANVHIFVKNRRGDVVKQLTLNDKPVNTPLAAAFKASLRPGTYTFRVYGTDRAGNAQSNTATNTLTVASGS